MKVFLNPGHKPGLDSGAVNPDTGATEASTVLHIASLVERYLINAGLAVEMLQSNSLCGEDADDDNPSICGTANASGADIFVSLHCNACTGTARGTETLMYSAGGTAEQLATCIQEQLVSTLQDIDPDCPDRGLKIRPDLAVLKYTAMPAVLVELAFIDNADDLVLLQDHDDDIARAVARGITDFECS